MNTPLSPTTIMLLNFHESTRSVVFPYMYVCFLNQRSIKFSCILSQCMTLSMTSVRMQVAHWTKVGSTYNVQSSCFWRHCHKFLSQKLISTRQIDFWWDFLGKTGHQNLRCYLKVVFVFWFLVTLWEQWTTTQGNVVVQDFICTSDWRQSGRQDSSY